MILVCEDIISNNQKDFLLLTERERRGDEFG
jgi:hypothetical protein